MESLARAEQIGPADAQVQYLLAVADRRVGQMAAFRTRLERAGVLGWSADDVERQEWLAAVQTGHVESLQSRVQQAVADGVPNDVAEEIYEAAAKGYLAVYRLRDAWKGLDVWLQWRPESAPARVLRGQLYEQLGDLPMAVEDFRAALAQLPGDRKVQIKLGQMLLQANRTEEAQEQFRVRLAAAPSDVDALLGMAQCACLLHDAAEARRSVAALLAEDLSPYQRGLAEAEWGRLLLVENKPREAVAPLLEAAELAPFEGSIHLSLMAALARSGQPEQARYHRRRAEEIREQQERMKLLRRRLIDAPNDADLRCEAGEILFGQGLTVEGAAWLNTALECDPGHHKAHQLLADYYAQAGNQQLAAHHRLLAASSPGPVQPSKPK
jgi:tetratricopeptide (TPR) repeat protein